jgi:hypothetical protein
MLSCVLLLLFHDGKLQDQATPALHVLLESQFVYMSSTQTAMAEHWIADGKSYEKRGQRVVIVRSDRGVRWVIDTQKGTYSETPLAPRAVPPKRGAQAEDIHTAGFSYEPEFAWTQTESEETSTVEGRRCRLTVATGTAEFAEAELKLHHAVARAPEMECKANALVLDAARFRYAGIGAAASEFLSKQRNALLMSLEATVEPPISPTMVHRVVVRTLEQAQPPGGLFDLPPGIRKSAS